jgi:hypothetical protein
MANEIHFESWNERRVTETQSVIVYRQVEGAVVVIVVLAIFAVIVMLCSA